MISKLAMLAKKTIEAAWLHGDAYDLATQAAEALESAQLLQSPETAADPVGIRQRLLDALPTEPCIERGTPNKLAAAEAEYSAWEIVADILGVTLPYAPVPSADESADRLTRLFAPTQVLRESAPDTPEDSPAALLALKMRTSQPDVLATEVINERTLRLTIKPQSLDSWNWWQARFNIDVSSGALRGSVMTATGRHHDVTVHFAAQGVPALTASAAKHGEGR